MWSKQVNHYFQIPNFSQIGQAILQAVCSITSSSLFSDFRFQVSDSAGGVQYNKQIIFRFQISDFACGVQYNKQIIIFRFQIFRFQILQVVWCAAYEFDHAQINF